MLSTPSPPVVGERLLLILGALAVSLLAGALVARVDFVWVAAVLGVLMALAMVFSREATLWFVIVSGLVVAGVLMMYVPGAGYFKYIPPLASAALLMHMLSDWLERPNRTVPSTVQVFLLFLGVSLLSMAANWQSFGMAAVGIKSYYPMWTLFLGLAMIRWRPGVIEAFPRVAVWLAFLQLPFVAHQFLFLVPMREGLSGVVPVDVVAGTFGGDIWGGGANSVLTVFLIIVCACVLGMWRHGAMSGFKALVTVLVLLTPVLLNSARAALIYLPIVFGMVFFSDVIRHPLRALAGLTVAGGLMVAILMSYTALNQTPNTDSWKDLVSNTWEYQLASERQRSGDYSSLSRVTVLTFWAEKQRTTAVMETLIGHGPGSSRVEERGLDLADTLAERRFGGRQIGYTAIAAVLWDVGVIGLVVVLGLFWAAFRQARRLMKFYAGRDPVSAGIAHGLSAGMVILVLSLAHKDFFVFHIPYQTLVACVFGYLAVQTRRMESAASSSAAVTGMERWPRSAMALADE